MAKLTSVVVAPPPVEFNLRLSLMEASALLALVGETAGDAKEILAIYRELAAHGELVLGRENFKFTDSPRLDYKD